MKEIVIREYQSQDWPRLIEIHDNARKIELQLAGLSDAFIPLVEAAPNEGLFEYTVCVALIDNTVVGFTAYSEDELAWIYVDPEYMRQGIGKQLVRHVVEHTTERPLCIEVLVGNDPAVRLYEESGFQKVKTVSGQMVGNEVYDITVYLMQMV